MYLPIVYDVVISSINDNVNIILLTSFLFTIIPPKIILNNGINLINF